jgi:protein involved in polysaccharide export with SLBB domain
MVGGEVENSGLQAMPASATASIAALHAGILPTGTTRAVEMVRGERRYIVDLYRMMVLGDLDSDFDLQPGDRIYVPAVKRYVEVQGEVIRSGSYEMLPLSQGKSEFTVYDLLSLTAGAKPVAALGKCRIERIGPDGKRVMLPVDLDDDVSLRGTSMQPGDLLVVPSVEAYQPIVRMIGEFKGEGVYQRAVNSEGINIQNKSGIYALKEGQTVLDLITATGGVTPQADLKRARVERSVNGVVEKIPVDLERLMVENDHSGDVVLKSGDILVLPAVADKVHIVGEIKAPGSYPYSPSRSLVDYLGAAGGPTNKSKLESVRIVRGTAESPQFIKVNVKSAFKGDSLDGNPVLESGDVVYVPSKLIGTWQDAVQMIFTAVSLNNLLR